MGIVDEDIARVRAATDFVAVAGEHVALRRVGSRWVGLCPFHVEKTPSFSVNGELGVYYCFGCGAGGDVITFVRETEHLDFVEAVEKLAGRAGIALHYDDAAGGRDHQRRARLYDAMERAVEWYHQRLLAAPDAAAARGYLRRERGYDGEVVRRYRLGWAPEGWDVLVRSVGVTPRELVDAGLAYVGDTGRHIDFFRGRLLFPIFEPAGRPVGTGGRVLPGGRGPKYKNTPNTAVYDKSRTLYGLNWAKKAVVDRGQVVVCEGYTDVIGLHIAGVAEAVATCGTALADGHVRALTNFARRIVLAYDADAAGQAAAERLYEWEQRFDVDIRVADLPEGADPADLAARDPEALRQAIGGARPYLAFRLERLLGRGDLSGPEGRARAAAAAMDLVSSHPNALVRDQYVMAVADRCRVDPSRLRAMVADKPQRSHPGVVARASQSRGKWQSAGPGVERPGDGSGGQVALLSGPETEALRVAVQHPEQVADRLQRALFGHPVAMAAFDVLAAASTFYDALEAADPQVSELLQRLAVEPGETDANDVMIRLVERAGRRAVDELRAEARASADPGPYAASMGWAKLAMEALRSDDPISRSDAERRLVDWLVARSQPDDGVWPT